jgi:3-isopropylmalate dehydrogenase
MARTYNIAVIKGDGTGPEVMAEGIKVISAAADKFGFKLNLTNHDIGAARYLRTGEVLPEQVLSDLKKSDAIYLSAVGDPKVKPGVLEKGLLLKIRFDLDQYINLRPVKLYPGVECPIKGKGPKEIDYTVIRENSGGMYTGQGGQTDKGTKNEVAEQRMIYTYAQVERLMRYAFDFAQKRGKKKKLAMVGKSNVLTYMYDLWNRVFDEVGKDYPDVTREYYHVDATCLYMIASPEIFDVIVTENMFGDIITDLAAITQGGLGVAAGGNINPKGVSMFEPIGGSAPMWTGKNAINPIACIGAGAMMLETLGEVKAANAIEASIAKTTPKMKSQLAGQMGFTTTEVGDLVAKGI